MVAEALVRRYGCTVVGLDQSSEMLAGAQAKLDRDPQLASNIELVRGEAESLPFGDGEFDHLTFTYLLRYVNDPGATLTELARVVKPGGRIASLEFMLPPTHRAFLWRAYTASLHACPRPADLPGLAEVGRFLGPSITDLYRRLPLDGSWSCGAGPGRSARGEGDELRRRRRDLGHAWLSRQAAGLLRPPSGRLARHRHRASSAVHGLEPGQRRFGAAAAAQIHTDRFVATLAAFFLAVGISAHTLDELNGRPLKTELSDRTLIALAAVSLAGAMGIGIAGCIIVSATLMPFVSAGGFFVVAYNLELFGGRFHTAFWLAFAWAAFPALTSWWVNTLSFASAKVGGGGRPGGGRVLRPGQRAANALDPGTQAEAEDRLSQRRAAPRRRHGHPADRGGDLGARSTRRSAASPGRWSSCRSGWS